MIKIRNMEQAQALSTVLDTEAGADRLDVSQYVDGVIGVSRLNRAGKVEVHTYIQTDGDTKTVDTEEERDAT